MKPMAKKLIAAVMALVLSVVMVVTISYAWMTLSNTPVVEGIQITIGGGNTILVAANRTQVVNGVVYNYPHVFTDTLNFSKYSEYDYLDSLASLSPVSTADGIHWFLPETYNIFDSAVVNGEATVGQIKPITEFMLDSNLEYANITKGNSTKSSRGNYIFLDFWVVSPGSDCTLRVSQGDENGGSFLLELMSPDGVDADGDGVYETFTLETSQGSVESAARIGFLVNTDNIVDDTMLYYQRSSSYSKNYTKLRGAYQTQGSDPVYSSGYRFTIYEPNGDLHPNGIDGTYSITNPVAWNGSYPYLASIAEHLTVQLANTWKTTDENGSVPITELFNAYITPIMKRETRTADELKNAFYNTYLQSQVDPYVNKGSFVQKTQDLYNYALNDGVVDLAEMNSLNKAGATDDTYIVALEKNVPQRIRMFVWLEGQDVDCTGEAGILDFALSIELAGSNQNKYGKK